MSLATIALGRANWVALSIVVWVPAFSVAKPCSRLVGEEATVQVPVSSLNEEDRFKATWRPLAFDSPQAGLAEVLPVPWELAQISSRLQHELGEESYLSARTLLVRLTPSGDPIAAIVRLINGSVDSGTWYELPTSSSDHFLQENPPSTFENQHWTERRYIPVQFGRYQLLQRMVARSVQEAGSGSAHPLSEVWKRLKVIDSGEVHALKATLVRLSAEGKIDRVLAIGMSAVSQQYEALQLSIHFH